MILTSLEKESFLSEGFLHLKNAISASFIEEWWGSRRDFLQRLSLDSDPSHIYFPRIRSFNLLKISPRTYEIATELLGGEDKIIESSTIWGDGFVVAQPRVKKSTVTIDNSSEYSWHKDGFFRHFLDSPEIGLVALVLWTDTNPTNGATAIAKGSIEIVAEDLWLHPEGLNPDFFDRRIGFDWPDQIFASGKAGDIYLMHPFLLHARRPNFSSSLRAITNPVIQLKEPMKFKGQNLSLVEQSILNALKITSIDFRITNKRESLKGKTNKAIEHTRELILKYLTNTSD